MGKTTSFLKKATLTGILLTNSINFTPFADGKEINKDLINENNIENTIKYESSAKHSKTLSLYEIQTAQINPTTVEIKEIYRNNQGNLEREIYKTMENGRTIKKESYQYLYNKNNELRSRIDSHFDDGRTLTRTTKHYNDKTELDIDGDGTIDRTLSKGTLKNIKYN